MNGKLRVHWWSSIAVLALVMGLVAAGPAVAASTPGFDGDPATTERILEGTPTGAAVAISQARFPGVTAGARLATSAVLSRSDAFADSLAGAALTADAPLLFTDREELPAITRDEIRRVVAPGGTVYLLGGPAAISDSVAQRVAGDGYLVRRLAGATRVETAIAVADEVRRRTPDGADVLLARADAPADNPTAAWADSLAGGALAAHARQPILLTPSADLHPAAAAWLAEDQPASTILLGGASALSDRVEGAAPNPRRISGPERSATAAAIATELWGAPASGSRRFTVVNGEHEQGWAFGLAVAGLAADGNAPVLLVGAQVPAPTRSLARTCGNPQVDVLVVGDGSVVAGSAREHLDLLDGYACGAGGKLVYAKSLQSLDSCDATLGYYRDHALERVGPWGFFEYGTPLVGDPEARPAPMPAVGEGDSAAGGDQHSGTNVQEEGVDEPDLTKTDGRHAFVVAKGRLQVVDVAGGEPRLLSGLELPRGWNHELLVDGTTVTVLTRAHNLPEAGDPEPQPQPDQPAADSAAMSSPIFFAPRLVVTAVDASDPANPRVTNTLEVDGDYRSARMVDGVARIVLVSAPHDLAFTMPESEDEEAIRAAEDHNRRVVAESTVENWLPSYTLTDAAGEESTGLVVGCGAVRRPPNYAGLSTLTVFAVDPGASLAPLSAAAVPASAETIYASTANLYVATSRWMPFQPGFAGEETTTELHAFDIASPTATRYRATVSVPGYLLNQFSLSEHAGHLRVATTEGAPWGPEPSSQSAVRIYAIGSDGFRQVGELGGLGIGERIFAVRYLGDLAALVTFRQVDPLYLLDLSDPTAPRVLGELKIPGYSAYLHRVSDTHLLGVGQDADEEGRIRGTQVSLFDISDRSRPQRVGQLTFPQGHSEVEYDHKAFLHWAPTNLAVLPLSQYSEGGEQTFVGAVGVSLAGGSLAEAGRLTHPGSDDPERSWESQIRRSFVVGTTLYTVSEAGIEAADPQTLAERAFVPFA